MGSMKPKSNKQSIVSFLAVFFFVGFFSLLAFLSLRGYGLDRSGEVVRSGLVVISSKPDNADIYLNEELNGDDTNASITTEEGLYDIRVSLPDRHDWLKKVELQVSEVQRLDYIRLYPQSFESIPQLAINNLIDYHVSGKQITILDQHENSTDEDNFFVKTYNLDDESYQQESNIYNINNADNLEIISSDNQGLLLKNDDWWLAFNDQAGTVVNISQTTDLSIIEVVSISGKYHILDDKNDLYSLDISSSVTDPPTVQTVKLAEEVKGFTGYDNGNKIAVIEDELKFYDIEDDYRELATIKGLEQVQNIEIFRHDGQHNLLVQHSDKVSSYNLTRLIENEAIKPTFSSFVGGDAVISVSKDIVLIADSDYVVVFDYKHNSELEFNFIVPVDQNSVNWMDGYNFMTHTADGHVIASDFDGTNQHVLTNQTVDSYFLSDEIIYLVKEDQPQASIKKYDPKN